jgi:hypothetical protein
MTELGGLPDPFADARDLPELLDAAYRAFEAMLAVIRQHDQPDDDYFVAMVMASASAASGRDYLLFAPSLPPRQLGAGRTGREQESEADGALAARWLTWLCRLLDARLAAAGAAAGLAGDRDACLGAAKSAREIAALTGGGSP